MREQSGKRFDPSIIEVFITKVVAAEEVTWEPKVSPTAFLLQ